MEKSKDDEYFTLPEEGLIRTKDGTVIYTYEYKRRVVIEYLKKKVFEEEGRILTDEDFY